MFIVTEHVLEYADDHSFIDTNRCTKCNSSEAAVSTMMNWIRDDMVSEVVKSLDFTLNNALVDEIQPRIRYKVLRDLDGKIVGARETRGRLSFFNIMEVD